MTECAIDEVEGLGAFAEFEHKGDGDLDQAQAALAATGATTWDAASVGPAGGQMRPVVPDVDQAGVVGVVVKVQPRGG